MARVLLIAGFSARAAVSEMRASGGAEVASEGMELRVDGAGAGTEPRPRDGPEGREGEGAGVGAVRGVDGVDGVTAEGAPEDRAAGGVTWGREGAGTFTGAGLAGGGGAGMLAGRLRGGGCGGALTRATAGGGGAEGGVVSAGGATEGGRACGGGGGAEGGLAGAGGAAAAGGGIEPTWVATSAAALNSSSERASALRSEACSAARRSHFSAAARSPRPQSALAVESAQWTSSSSSGRGGGIGASIGVLTGRSSCITTPAAPSPGPTTPSIASLPGALKYDALP